MRSHIVVGFAVVTLPLVTCQALAQGFRIDGALFLVHPELGARSGEVFAALGEFRTGMGMDVGIGYDVRQYGVTLSGGFAGIDVGEPFSGNGIGMGRQPGIYHSTALSAQWRTSNAVGGWRPRLSLGYVRSGLDNMFLPGDSLPEFARSLGGTPPDTIRRLVGVSGVGARFGLALGREISSRDSPGSVVLNIGATLDAARFGRMLYGGNGMTIPGAGTSLVPRLNVALLWSPWAPRPQEVLRGQHPDRTRVNRR